jgi:hypothetical protein
VHPYRAQLDRAPVELLGVGVAALCHPDVAERDEGVGPGLVEPPLRHARRRTELAGLQQQGRQVRPGLRSAASAASVSSRTASTSRSSSRSRIARSFAAAVSPAARAPERVLGPLDVAALGERHAQPRGVLHGVPCSTSGPSQSTTPCQCPLSR